MSKCDKRLKEFECVIPDSAISNETQAPARALKSSAPHGVGRQDTCVEADATSPQGTDGTLKLDESTPRIRIYQIEGVVMDRPRLGQRVRVRAFAYKDSVFPGEKSRGLHYRTKYSRSEYKTLHEGLFMGYRFHPGGRVDVDLDYWDSSREAKFSQDNTVELWIIVLDSRRNPIRAFPEDVEVI